ncbi:MAG: hypothetical protein UCH28_05895, partial [Adlercreutzia sp.]|nr:hypothetical protein [Adlercreutzia sp.]
MILATAATADTKGLKVSFSEIPAAHAMDTADAVTYQWTAPLYTKAAGDVGEIEPAYRTIAGYVWKDNDYHDGFYTYRLSAQATDPGYPDPEETGNYEDRSKLKLEKPEEGRIGTNLFLRQWYFDTEANNGAGEWKPIKEYNPDVTSEDGSFWYAKTKTQAANTAKDTVDGYYEFTNLPVRVIVDGKEYLAGYTVAVLGNLSYKPSDHEAQATPDPTWGNRTDYDTWNSKAYSIVKSADADAARYGVGTFPLKRKDAYSSNGDIHTLDSMLVLAGSTETDAQGDDVATTQYPVRAEGMNGTENVTVSFDLTFGKNETRINGGFVMPPAAPIEGYIWNDKDYDGIREEGEAGIADVQLRITQYYLLNGKWVRTPNDPTYVRTAKADNEEGLEVGQYKTQEMPASYRPDELSTNEYLCGYRVEVVELPAGATLSRPHASENHTESSYNDDSDIYRTDSAFPLVNRYLEVKDGEEDAKVRADGMAIIARKLIEGKDVADASKIKYDDVTYDITTAVQTQQGGDAGLVYIPSTTIKGIMWDDSYVAPEDGDDVKELAARNRAYNGVRDEGEPGLAGRTLKLTQWAYDNGTWTQVGAFGGGTGVATAVTDANGNYAFKNVPSAIRQSVGDLNASRITVYEADGTTPTAAEELRNDRYLLASYQAELNGLESGADDGEWMLTRYHEGTDTTRDADVAGTKRTGVAGGMPVSDITTIVDANGTEQTGTRFGVGASTKGARIVVASEGVLGTTNLAASSDYINVPMTQLLSGDGINGTAAYDWLTVDKEATLGGDMGAVKPTLQRISGIIWNDANNNGIQEEKEAGVNGYKVTLERYYFPVDGTTGTWVADADFVYDETATEGSKNSVTTYTQSLYGPEYAASKYRPLDGESLKCGQILEAAAAAQTGYYEFNNLKTTGMVDGKRVVYAYKVRVDQPDVVNEDVFKAKYQVTDDYTT